MHLLQSIALLVELLQSRLKNAIGGPYIRERKNDEASISYLLVQARPKQEKMSKSKMKTIMIYFFENKAIVYKKFVSPGLTINQQYYKQVLDWLRKRVFKIDHDNAPPIVPSIWRNFDLKTSSTVAVMLQPPLLTFIKYFNIVIFFYSSERNNSSKVSDIQTFATKLLYMLPVEAFYKC